VTWWLVTFSRLGPARYISHLDTVRAVQRTLSRAGIDLAMTEGMRPKPRLSLPLPLPVGAVGLEELAVAGVEDDVRADPATLRALRAAGAGGLRVERVVETAERPRPQAEKARYECALEATAEAVRAELEWFAAQPAAMVERRSPKRTRALDLRQFVSEPQAAPDGAAARLAFTLRYDAEGAARPDEFVGLLCERLELEPVVHDLVRSSVTWQGLAPELGV
jgi:radical SAM-linked protein